jgi:hypothetical protein
VNLRLIVVATSALGLLVATGPTAVHADSQLSSSSCSKYQKKAKQAKKVGNAKKAKRLKKKYKTCKKVVKREATVTRAISGYTFTGTRGDRQPMTVTFCPDGKWSSRTGYQPVAVSTGSSWFVRNLNYSSGSTWVTQVGENKNRDKGGWGIGLARDGDSFQIGIDSFDTVTSLGPVERISGADVCATL